MSTSHQVVTADYPENRQRGIMICGIDYGYSSEDEAAETTQSAAAPVAAERKSFISDSSVRKSDKFRARMLRWLDSWGVKLESEPGKETRTERAYFQTNWIDEQNHKNSGPVDLLVSNSEGFLGLLAQRQPRVVLFGGVNLIEALNDSRILDDVESILGPRPGNPEIHRGQTTGGVTAFKVMRQVWPKTTVVSLPHPTGTRGLSDAYMAQFASLLKPILAE